MIRISIAALATVLAFSLGAIVPRAEIAPKYYEEMRRGAQLVAILHVDEVKTFALKSRGKILKIQVEAKGRVFSVIRGKLRLYSTIAIRYTRATYPRGRVGPAPVPILKKGTRVVAWLNRAGGIWEAAARGRSFATLR